MTTFAQTYNSIAHNVVIGEAFDDAVLGKYVPAWVESEIADGRPWSQVPDGTIHGAKSDGQGGWVNPSPPAPQPNNVGNPYFGKATLATKDFFALVGQVLGARYPRLRNDPAFLWVYDVLTKVDIVDVDDRAGQFLQILQYLTHTNAQDGQPLMSAQDVTAIMAAWK